MRALWTGLALFLCLSVALAEDWNQSIKLSLKTGSYEAGSLDVPVYTDLQVAVTASSCEITYCLSFLVKAHHDWEEWGTLCADTINHNFWGNSTGDGKATALNLHPGINYLTATALSGSCDATFAFSGTSCPSGEYPDVDGTCNNPKMTDYQKTFTLQAKEKKIYLWDTATSHFHDSWGNAQLTFTASGEGQLRCWTREGLPPTNDVYDEFSGDASETATVNVLNPRHTARRGPGRDLYNHFMMIENTSDQETTVTFDANTPCGHFHHGQNCDILPYPVVESHSIEIVGKKQGDWVYFIPLIGNMTDEFRVGVQPLEGQRAPAIYARFGNIPTSDQFDAKLYDEESHGDARYYTSGDTDMSDAAWFFAVVAEDSNQVGDYIIWFETECPQDCTGNGDCKNHQCDCDSGYTIEPYTCSLANLDHAPTPQPPEDDGMSGGEIALIVIVVLISLILVVSIAANVFLGWRYFRGGNSSSGGSFSSRGSEDIYGL